VCVRFIPCGEHSEPNAQSACVRYVRSVPPGHEFIAGSQKCTARRKKVGAFSGTVGVELSPPFVASFGSNFYLHACVTQSRIGTKKVLGEQREEAYMGKGVAL
jgi:hypothetical protein